MSHFVPKQGIMRRFANNIFKNFRSGPTSDDSLTSLVANDRVGLVLGLVAFDRHGPLCCLLWCSTRTRRTSGRLA